MKFSGHAALVYLVVGLAFAVLGAVAVTVCVKVFHMTILTAGMVSMPVSYTFGMLLIWWLGLRGQRR